MDMNTCIRGNLPRLILMGWTMTYVSSIHGERELSELPNVVVNNFVLQEGTKCIIAHAQ